MHEPKKMFYSVDEVASKMNVSDWTIKEKIANHELFAVKVGNCWRIFLDLKLEKS